MVVLSKHIISYRDFVRDVRPASVRIKEYWNQTDPLIMMAGLSLFGFGVLPHFLPYADIGLIFIVMYARWVFNATISLPFKMPKYARPLPDPNNPAPGKAGAGKSDGILFVGNLNDADDDNHKGELWLTNNDARTHILFLGTTGSGKTEGLKSLITNSLTWGSGFVYVDGKADTDLWASLYALTRRFGRDDDILVLNYMTANSDDGAVSNTMNPFSNGSASYITNLVVSLMPDAGGDNAMWKERAVALMGALMPALTFKRDRGELLFDVSALRDFIELPAIIKLSRDDSLPERIHRALTGYLDTLPGYVDEAFDDEGKEKPPSPDQPMHDLQVCRQQHGYLSMQFTRALQSLADDYGYIFRAQLADVDVLDVVINRRILVALIPSLEKSGDEAANLGKIVVASLKGMMGATLGNTVEGGWEQAIGSKQTRAASSFMTVFDEVGYYTAQGMAVMAAQARSLGFSLIFAAQDLPSMEKRVKQEAQSILANCNLKIFGKLEDPGDTKKFLEDHAGKSFVMDSTGMSVNQDTMSGMFMNKPFYDNMGTTGIGMRANVVYEHLRDQREGEVHLFFAEYIAKGRMFYAVPERVKALRVQVMLPVPATTDPLKKREKIIKEVANRLNDTAWTADEVAANPNTPPVVERMAQILGSGNSTVQAAAVAVGGLPEVATDNQKFFDDPAPEEQATSTGKASSVGMPWDSGSGSDQESEEDLPPIFPKTRHSSSYVPKDIDMDIIPQISTTGDITDVTTLALPDDVSAHIEGMAEKLNKGLGSKESK